MSMNSRLPSGLSKGHSISTAMVVCTSSMLHVRGHINILACSDDSGGWIYLGGASFLGVRRLLTGEKEVARFHEESGNLC